MAIRASSGRRRWRCLMVMVLALLGIAVHGALASTPSPQATVPLPQAPQLVAVDASTGTAYVTDISPGLVQVVSGVDGSSPALSATISVPGAFGVGDDASLGLLYVGDYSAGQVTLVDTSTSAVVATVPVGASGASHRLGPVGVDPGLHTAWVADFAQNVAYEIDGSTRRLLRTVPVGANPSGVAVDDRTHRVYVADQGADEITVLDGTTGAAVATIPIGFQTRPDALAVDDSTDTVWVALPAEDEVGVLDGATDTVTSTSSVAPDSPDGVAVDPTTHAAYFIAGSDLLVLEPGVVSREAITSTAGIALDTAARTALIGAESPSRLVDLGAHPSTTTVGSSANPVQSGAAVSYLAEVVPDEAGGTVSFTLDGGPINGCAEVPVVAGVSQGTATCRTTGGAAGLHQVAATYSGTASADGSAATLAGGERITAAPPAAVVTRPSSPAASPPSAVPAAPPASRPSTLPVPSRVVERRRRPSRRWRAVPGARQRRRPHPCDLLSASLAR